MLLSVGSRNGFSAHPYLSARARLVPAQGGEILDYHHQEYPFPLLWLALTVRAILPGDGPILRVPTCAVPLG